MSVLRTYLGRAAVACVEHGFRCSPSGGALCFPLSAVRGGVVAPFDLGVWLLLGAVPYVVVVVWLGGLRRGRRAGPGVRGMICALVVVGCWNNSNGAELFREART